MLASSYKANLKGTTMFVAGTIYNYTIILKFNVNILKYICTTLASQVFYMITPDTVDPE